MSRLVILISGSNEVFAYANDDIRKGKKYTYQEITDFMKESRPDKYFSVAIKAAKNATYTNIVDMLDVMTTTDIKHYALVDITKEEEGYLHQIYP